MMPTHEDQAVLLRTICWWEGLAGVWVSLIAEPGETPHRALVRHLGNQTFVTCCLPSTMQPYEYIHHAIRAQFRPDLCTPVKGGSA